MKVDDFIKLLNKYCKGINEFFNISSSIEFNLNVSKDFEELYSKFDGEKFGEFVGIFCGFKWMSKKEILLAIKLLNETIGEKTSNPRGYIKEMEYCKGWIPFAEDGGGNYIAIDMEPDTKGSMGQVIGIDNDNDMTYIISQSLEEFYDYICKEIECNKIQLVNEEETEFFQWNSGHFFNDIDELLIKEDLEESIKLDRFWIDFFGTDVNEGTIKLSRLKKEKSVGIWNKDRYKNEYGKISLEVLKYMTNLKELIIHYDEVESFQPIENLSELKKIYIGGKDFEENDIEYLVGLKMLKEVGIMNSNIKSIKGLKDLISLKSLRLLNDSFINIEELGEFTKLSELSIENLKCDNYSFLKNLRKLKKLEITKMNIDNLDFLEDLKNIVHLEIDGEVNDDIGIEYIRNMKKLKVCNYPLGDLNVVKECPLLKEIRIDGSRVSNIQALKNSNITSISIYNGTSKEEAKEVIEEVKKYCNIVSSGWRVDWE